MSRIGVEGLNAYCGLARLPVRTFFEKRGLRAERYDNLMMDQRSVQLPWEDPVTNAVNAARPLVDALAPEDRDQIELVVTSTESGLDLSKSLTTYVHEHLGLRKQCRLMEVKQACYGATGALQLAVGYLASGLSPGAKALIVATDVNPMDERAEYAEPMTGHGAVAILVGDQPTILTLDAGAYGLHCFETLDTARPTPDFDLYNADQSLLAYLECLSGSYQEYARRVPSASLSDSFDYVVMHTPFAGLVKAAHRKLMREVEGVSRQAIEADFERRVLPSLMYPRDVGNICSGAVWLALASLVDNAPANAVPGARLAMFSYGSGCASEFFSGVLGSGVREVVGARRIGERLRRRAELTFGEYEELLPVTRNCLVPRAHHTVDASDSERFYAPFREYGPLLALRSVEDYRRQYEWLA